MQIKPDEITSILKSRIEGLDDGGADLSEVGTVLSIADGISRVHGLDNCMSLEMLELPHDVTGLALNLESDNVGAVLFGDWDKIEEGDTVKRTGQPARDPGRRGAARPHRRPARPAARRQGRHQHHPDPPGRVQGARAWCSASRVKEPMQTGIKAIDSMTADRPRPARADHRRPPDRQDRDRDRHDHQQPRQRPGLDLRGHRPAHVDGGAGGRDARRPRRDGQHDHRGRARRRGRADQVHGPLRRLRDGRALPLQRQARALHLRRPDQARVRVPPDVAAAAPPAGPRGLPGRRLLPALPPAGARGQAQRRPRRRLAHRAADHRDPGGRRVGLHPDQRHLDHRRPDLPRGRPVPLGRAAGDQRGHLGVARGRQRAAQGDEEGGRQAAPGAVAVPRAGGVRAVRLRARRRHPGHAGPRRAAGRDCSTRTSSSPGSPRTRWRRSTRAPAATSTGSRSSASASSTSRCSSACTPRSPT